MKAEECFISNAVSAFIWKTKLAKKHCKEFLTSTSTRTHILLSIAPNTSNQGSLKRYHFKVKKCQIYTCIYTINIILNYSVRCVHNILCSRDRGALHFSEGKMRHPWFLQSVVS